MRPSDDPLTTPRATNGRAPDVFRPGAWTPMRCHSDNDEVDFAIVGTGAGGGTLACKLAEYGFSVVALDAGPYWRPLEDFASDEREQSKLYWTDERIVDGETPLELGANNSGKSVGGSTVHFAMVSLRFRPEWFKARTTLGYGVDWPLDWREMWGYYREVEEALKISGPIHYPVGAEAAALPIPAARAQRRRARARGGRGGARDRLDADAARDALRPARPCAALRLSRLLRHRLLDQREAERAHYLAAAGAGGRRGNPRPRHGRPDRARRHGARDRRALLPRGRWRFQRARNVVVAGYAIETPRLLLNSASAKFPDGLANCSGLVGRNLMVQSNQAVWGLMDREVRAYKGPPSLAITEHWNYTDAGKDFFGGYAYMSQGPLPIVWAGVQAAKRGLWGAPLIEAMKDYNHVVGLKIVGECMPQERNGVTLTDERDDYGLPIPRVTYSSCDNDKRLIKHALKFMRTALEAVRARDIFDDADDTCHLNGTARMGDDPATSVVDADCRAWDIPNLWICDGSVFPTVGGVNPSLTIQAIACRTADRIREMARGGEL